MNHTSTTRLCSRILELQMFHRLLWSQGPQFTTKFMFYLDFALITTPNIMQIVKASIRYQPTKKFSAWTQQNTWRLAGQHRLTVPLAMPWLVAYIAFIHLLLPILITGTITLVKLIWIRWDLYLTNTRHINKVSFEVHELTKRACKLGIWFWSIIQDSSRIAQSHKDIQAQENLP